MKCTQEIMERDRAKSAAGMLVRAILIGAVDKDTCWKWEKILGEHLCGEPLKDAIEKHKIKLVIDLPEWALK